MYSQISSNRRRTVILITVFVLVIGLIGWVYGEYSGAGPNAVGFAVGISIIMALFSYYAGDKIALLAAGARGPLKKTDAPELFRLLENLAIASGVPAPKLYLIPDGAINAFATGRDPAHASVAVTAGAVQKLEKTELEGVLAHELSHVKNYDIRYMLLVAVLVGAIVLLADWLRNAFFWGGGKRREERDSGGGLIVLIGLLIAILAPLLAQLIKMAVSRQREYLADASGALLTRYPEGLASALEKISRDTDPLDRANEATAHLYFSNPFGNVSSAVVRLFSTHPPVEERVKRLRTMAV
ncbi:zinc metalloprotease HtpX [Patescibacteria group bacterium]|nr:MAG: zinc metalloprotease HtpX [Patescibacteria group bacterium]